MSISTGAGCATFGFRLRKYLPGYVLAPEPSLMAVLNHLLSTFLFPRGGLVRYIRLDQTRHGLEHIIWHRSTCSQRDSVPTNLDLTLPIFTLYTLLRSTVADDMLLTMIATALQQPNTSWHHSSSSNPSLCNHQIGSVPSSIPPPCQFFCIVAFVSRYIG